MGGKTLDLIWRCQVGGTAINSGEGEEQTLGNAGEELERRDELESYTEEMCMLSGSKP